MKWAIEQRMRFIEAFVAEHGRINRSDLVNKFRISIPQASQDLSRYQNMAPKNLVYDFKQKVYLKARRFAAVFAETV